MSTTPTIVDQHLKDATTRHSAEAHGDGVRGVDCRGVSSAMTKHLVLFVSVLCSLSAGDHPARQSVYVLVSRDSRVLTMCPIRWGQNVDAEPSRIVEDLQTVLVTPTTYSIRFADLRSTILLPVPSLGRGTPRAGGAMAAGPTEIGTRRIALDLELKARIERALWRTNRYELTASPATADIVLISEGIYIPLAAWASSQGGGGVFVTFGQDWEANFLSAILSIAVPGPAFRQHRGDIDALVAARTWEGASLQRQEAVRYERRFLPAEPGDIAKRFDKNERPPRHYPRICPASPEAFDLSGIFADPRRADALQANDFVKPGERARDHAASIFRAETSAVVVPMTVTSDRGDFIEDLQLHDVRVFEDDVEQDIDRLLDQNAPSTLALLIDVSGSMRLEIEDIKSALMSFLARIRAETKVLVATFDDRILVHAEPTTDLRTLVGAITHIERGIGSRLHDAIEIVVTERLNELPGRKAIVMLTDGVDTRSRLSTAAQSLSRASEGQIAIHVLQYDTSDANRLMSFPSAFSPVMSPPGATGMTGSYTAALKNLVGLTEATGGLTYWAPTVAGVKNALNRIATELNEQYAVAYYPFNVARDGSYRKIRVDVLRPGVTVRARKGYRAPSVP